MELHAVQGGGAVAEAHDDAVVGAGSDVQFGGHGGGFYGEGVVAGGGEGAGEVFEDGGAVVDELGGFAVHEFGGVGDDAAEGFCDGLVAEADAEEGFVGVGCPADEVDDDAGVCGVAGAG